MNDIESRFNQAVEEHEKEELIFKFFVDSSLDLVREIAARGAVGGRVTECEKRFIEASMLLVLNGLVEALTKKCMNDGHQPRRWVFE